MNSNTQIINHLKKAVYNLQIYTEEAEITLEYSIYNSLVKGEKKNQFYYQASEKEIKELAKKDLLELFEFLATKHLERNKGFGQNPKQFQTPCYLCDQKTLTTLGWSEAGYPANLERFFCRLCRTSFGWIDIKDDPDKLNEKLVDVHDSLVKKQQLLEKLKANVPPPKKIEPRTPI